MTTASGLSFVFYLARCALPAGHTLTKQDQYGNSYAFTGALGLARGWEAGGTSNDDRSWVSSCLMAHINTSGQHIPLFLDGEAPLGWGRDVRNYPMQEGTFVGDLFSSPPVAKSCTGRGYGANIVAGRIGATQVGSPYTAMVDANGSSRCDYHCSLSSDNSGYYACDVPGHTVTVWRPLINAPTYDFETDLNGFIAQNTSTVSSVLVRSSGNFLSPAVNGHALRIDVTATGAGELIVKLPNPAGIVPGKKMVVFFKNLSGTNWSYAQAFAQDGPGKN